MTGVTNRRFTREAVFGALGVLACLGLNWSAADAKTLTIGWTSYPTDSPSMTDAVAGGKRAAASIGVNVVFALASGAAAQANAMDNLIAQKVDAIVIDPEDAKAIGPSIVKANAAGIPVIMWIERNHGEGKTVTYVGSDEEEGGYKIAKWGFEQLHGKGKVALIQGSNSGGGGSLREVGFRRALKEYPGIQLVGYGEANWQADRANTLAADMLTSDPEIQIVFAFNDVMAQGVVTAAKVSGLKPMITGYNGTCLALNLIWNGNMTATLYQGFADIGSKIVMTAADAINGKSIEPKIVMPTFVVDKTLMEKVVGGTAEGATEGLTIDVKRAVEGCK